MEGSIVWSRDKGGSAGKKCQEIDSIRSKKGFPFSLNILKVTAGTAPSVEPEEQPHGPAELYPSSKTRDLMEWWDI